VFDGIRSQVISDPIGGAILAEGVGYEVQTPLIVTGNLYSKYGFYQIGTDSIWWIHDTGIDESFNYIRKGALIYNPRHDRWSVPQLLTDNVYSAMQGSQPSSFYLDGKFPFTYLGGVGLIYQLSYLFADDNGTAIPYSWVTPLTAPETKARYLVESIEDYFTQQSTPGQEVTVDVFGYDQPRALVANRKTILSGTHDLSGGLDPERPDAFVLKPTPEMSQTQWARWLQVKYSGSATAAMSWGGGNIYVDPEAQ
jgi:hypothetical protein